MSDPRTHPGKKATMLYETKWEGYDTTTWEPVDSFADNKIVLEYRRRVGLEPKKNPELKVSSTAPQMSSVPSRSKSKSPAKNATQSKSAPTSNKSEIEMISSDEEDGFEVEAIMGHHMSDPRTHPGKEATMLYKVKWVGFKQPTWEPFDSFVDTTIVKQYQKRMGLR
jgi:hypothetical protein